MPQIVDPLESTRPPVSIILLAGVIAALWFGALGVEIAARLLANAYARLGADVPDTTQALIATVRALGHYVAAAVGTLVLIIAAMRRPGSFGAFSAMILSVALVASAVSAVLLAWPSGQCGEIRPNWPNDRAAQVQGGPSAAVCGKGVR